MPKIVPWLQLEVLSQLSALLQCTRPNTNGCTSANGRQGVRQTLSLQKSAIASPPLDDSKIRHAHELIATSLLLFCMASRDSAKDGKRVPDGQQKASGEVADKHEVNAQRESRIEDILSEPP